MQRRHVSMVLAVSTLLFVGILLMTNPTTLSSVFLIAPFLLLFIILWSASFLIMRSAQFSRLRSARLSLLVGGVPVGLLLLQSIGQLAIRDVIIILLFFAIAYFYVARLSTHHAEAE